MTPYLVLFHKYALEESRPLVCSDGGSLCSHRGDLLFRQKKKKEKETWIPEKCLHCVAGLALCGNVMRMAPLPKRYGPRSFHLLVRLTASSQKHYGATTSCQNFHYQTYV